MKATPDNIIQSILNFRLKNLKEGIENFKKNKNLFLSDSQSKIEEIIEKDPSDKELLFEILNHDYIRPAFVIQDNDFQIPSDHPWAPILNLHKENIQRAVRSVGIFEILRGGKKFPSGTGWLLSEDLVVTNQHVTEVFCEKVDGKFQIKKGFEKITIDFNEEFERIHDYEFKVTEIVHVEEDDTSIYDHTPDLAILRVEKINENGEKLPPPLTLYNEPLAINQPIAIIGFPSADYKLPLKRKRVFNNIYDVKRVQPGLIKNIKMLYEFDFKHDCATLVGNSGSPVLDIATGKVVGTHFAGSLNVFEGYAVRTEVLKNILAKLS